MTDLTIGRTPALKAVWAEQLRVVGLAFRLEIALAAGVLFLVGLTVVAVIRIPALSALVDASPTDLLFDPGEPPWAFSAVLVGLFLPLIVWKGERPFSDTPLWTLPVDHRRHALAKVGAGWVWLMALLASCLLWIVIAVLAGGGSLGIDEIRVLVLDWPGAAAGMPGAAELVRWTTPWWEWVLPFTASTATYLLASALLLATPHPLRWAAGIWAVGFAWMVVADISHVAWIARVADMVTWFIGGDAFTGSVQLPTGRREGWRVLPSLGMWAASAAFWIGLGAASVRAAAGRPRDPR